MKMCPLCGNQIFNSSSICEECEMEYDDMATIEKRKKEHVVDGGTWWKVKRDAPRQMKKVRRGSIVGGCVIKNKPVCFTAYIDCDNCNKCLVSRVCKVNTVTKPTKTRRKKTPKHAISSDENLNEVLKEEVQELRGMIVETAGEEKLPSRFEVIPCGGSPSMMIYDNHTGRKVTVPIFAYKEIRKVLRELFDI